MAGQMNTWISALAGVIATVLGYPRAARGFGVLGQPWFFARRKNWTRWTDLPRSVACGKPKWAPRFGGFGQASIQETRTSGLLAWTKKGAATSLTPASGIEAKYRTRGTRLDFYEEREAGQT